MQGTQKVGFGLIGELFRMRTLPVSGWQWSLAAGFGLLLSDYDLSWEKIGKDPVHCGDKSSPPEDRCPSVVKVAEPVQDLAEARHF